jgi:hypothetical protein
MVRMTDLTAEAVQRPSLALLGAEPFRAVMEFAWHKLAKSDATQPGDGHPVVNFPGLGAVGNSVATLRAHCRSLGFDAFDWGQGFNTGPQGHLDTWLHTLKVKVVQLLAGHSELLAPHIRQVIAIGGFQRNGRPYQLGLALSRAKRQYLRTPSA